jgi:hypothetical protein
METAPTLEQEEQEILALYGLTEQDLVALPGCSTLEAHCAWCEPGSNGSHGVCEGHAETIKAGRNR